MTEFAEFLLELRKRLEPLEHEAAVAWWDANTRSDEATEHRAAETQKQLARVYSDPNTFAGLVAYPAAALAPDDRRQQALLRNAFIANQMDDAVIAELIDLERLVESSFNRYRPVLRGEPTGDNTLRDILRASDDAALRREAWEAGKSIGSVIAPDVLKLVTLRNREARRLGYPDYYHMALSLQEIEPDTLLGILDDIAAKTEELFGDYKASLDRDLADRFQTSVSALEPWHYGDPFFQEAPSGNVDLDRYFAGRNLEAITSRFFADIGFDIADILARSDLYERDGKCQHAFCIHVGRFDDVRVLCNCVSNAQWMATMLHEFGHAIYDKYLGKDLGFFLREPSHIMTTEAIAMLFGRLSRDAWWLSHYADVPADEVKEVAPAAKREQSAQFLVFARWCLVMAHFERELYANPDQDLAALWWQLVQRYQGIHPPSGREGLPDWASKIHLAVSPVYYHNYLLGEMLASQIWDRLFRRESTHTFDPSIGDYLRREIFARGARLPWNELVVAATGEALDARHLVGHLELEGGGAS